MELLLDPNVWLALLTLTSMEIVLGIDNVIFISILVARLPEHQREQGRVLGLGLAMLTRILLLLSIAWVMKLTQPFFTVMGYSVSGRDMILLFGGLFLIYKSTSEIHACFEGQAEADPEPKVSSFLFVLIQIAILDLVFSLDSVITAVGMADDVEVMILAIVLAVGVMMFAAKGVGDFVERHPTVKMLALTFLTLIGFTLLAEGLGLHIPKGYIYFAMGFSVIVELLNLRVKSKRQEKSLLKLKSM
ncbi:TerC family protein [Shewanella psychropiezotolerans]|uniref:TerC family protein n=1 Tax=Shewanella psychropiezotolerans TaxID=2593655 RepID=A0ABX5X296_9GAMM|nr:TerC family protein [Shewanella psychropiezotolerans]QDO85451.1 TerC family protein [Shewanella psychropiezotolerans]